jgi:hypothetical protein
VSRRNKDADKPVVKVPKSGVGRAVFWGGQAAAAFSALRSVKAARAKGDKLALVHATLTGAVLVATALVAVRTVREDQAAKAADADAEDTGDTTLGLAALVAARRRPALTAGGGK